MQIEKILNPTEEQTAWIRKNYLTSSKLVCLDDGKRILFPYTKDYKDFLYHFVTGKEKEFNEFTKQIMKEGIDLEPKIFKKISQLENFKEYKFTRKKIRYIIKDYKVASELDGEIDFKGVICPLEIKVSSRDHKTLETYYRFQLELNMRILNTDKILFISYGRNTKKLTYSWVYSDNVIWYDLLERIDTFWKDVEKYEQTN